MNLSSLSVQQLLAVLTERTQTVHYMRQAITMYSPDPDNKLHRAAIAELNGATVEMQAALEQYAKALQELQKRGRGYNYPTPFQAVYTAIKTCK